VPAVSEPGSGSDLAGLATSARRDGDEWVVNGQKVWTTLAHQARWGLLLARTDPTVPKHRGLTYFGLDMTSPGVEVRPLRQMTGDAEFNEVYLTDVRIPDANRVGDVGQGWGVAMTTLMNERVSLGSVNRERGSGPIGQAVSTFRHHGGPGLRPVERDRLAHSWARAEAGRLTNLRASGRRGRPGPEGSVAKLQTAELNKDIYDLGIDLLGPAGLLVSGYEMTRPDNAGVHGGDEIPKAFLRSRANTIEGGTGEILRNVLAERVLGLPGEPRNDNALPWSEVPRS
jgi:alkylation response protein AidB-like acyl-CoA dehydrogenase